MNASCLWVYGSDADDSEQMRVMPLLGGSWARPNRYVRVAPNNSIRSLVSFFNRSLSTTWSPAMNVFHGGTCRLPPSVRQVVESPQSGAAFSVTAPFPPLPTVDGMTASWNDTSDFSFNFNSMGALRCIAPPNGKAYGVAARTRAVIYNANGRAAWRECEYKVLLEFDFFAGTRRALVYEVPTNEGDFYSLWQESYSALRHRSEAISHIAITPNGQTVCVCEQTKWPTTNDGVTVNGSAQKATIRFFKTDGETLSLVQSVETDRLWHLSAAPQSFFLLEGKTVREYSAVDFSLLRSAELPVGYDISPWYWTVTPKTSPDGRFLVIAPPKSVNQLGDTLDVFDTESFSRKRTIAAVKAGGTVSNFLFGPPIDSRLGVAVRPERQTLLMKGNHRAVAPNLRAAQQQSWLSPDVTRTAAESPVVQPVFNKTYARSNFSLCQTPTGRMYALHLRDDFAFTGGIADGWRLMKSDDRARTWQEMDLLMWTDEFFDAEVMVATGLQGMLFTVAAKNKSDLSGVEIWSKRSLNDGQTWEEAVLVGTLNALYGVAFHLWQDPATAHLFSSNGNQFFISCDLGRTWTERTEN